MAVFYRQDAGKLPSEEASFAGKLFNKAKNLSETVPADIRNKLASLSAEVNGKTDELKKATKENADKLKTEIRDLSRTTTQEYVREDKTARLKKDKRFEKLLANKKGFDTITAGDIGRLRETGENIANFLLTDDDGDEVNLTNTSVETFKNKKLLINFGDNSSLNASIGLGDILPYEVKKVEITDKNGKITTGTLGSKDSRKGRPDRVGYYDENGIYIAIYGGYSIKVLETGTVNAEEKNTYEGLQNENLKRLRINEMMDFCIAKNGLKKISLEEVKTILEKEYLDNKDVILFSEVSEKINSKIARGEHIRESYKDGIGSRDKFVGKFGWYMRDVIGKDFPNVPAHMLVNLFDKESNPRGSFDPGAQNASGAYGLGQMQPDAWADAEKHANINYNRTSPYDQIHASAAYLNFIMAINNCNIQDAVVYYHMGPYVKSRYIDTNNIVMLEKYKKSNPAVAKEMKEDTWDGYMKAARYYYTEEPSLLPSLDLSTSGTELATKLGDYVMSTSLPNTGTSSCGEAVGTLLNKFGVESLPQYGRDGKNWDTILELRIQSGQFKKVPIKHPDEAGSGAILVFDEGASGVQKGSKRFDFGHVEIKGSDGKYYSYYEGTRAAGSAANSSEGVKDPAEYRRITGFTGYAYYPVTKKV